MKNIDTLDAGTTPAPQTAVDDDPEIVLQSQEDARETAAIAERDVLGELNELQAALDALKNVPAEAPDANVAAAEAAAKQAKNRVAAKPDANRKYVRIADLDTTGKIPRQQADLAKILTESMDIGKEWSEAEVFSLVEESASEYPSLANSKQAPSYLFRYYRSLKADGKRGGFIARGFLQQIG
jgi:hypothetical protein